MIEAQRRHFGYAEQTAGEQPPMPGNNLALAIDQDRDIEPKARMLLAICRICLPL
jgi:hypothetical protein